MEYKEQIYALVILGPIVGLLLVGFWVTLRSGLTATAGEGRGRRLMVNASHTAMLVAVCLFVLAVIQHMVGFHSSLM